MVHEILNHVRLHKCVCMTYSSCFITLFMNYTCRSIWASQMICCHTTPHRYCGKFHTWCGIQKSVQQCVTCTTASVHISVQLHLWWQTLNSKSVFRTVEPCPAKRLTDSVAIHTLEFHGLPIEYSMHKQTYMVGKSKHNETLLRCKKAKDRQHVSALFL